MQGDLMIMAVTPWSPSTPFRITTHLHQQRLSSLSSSSSSSSIAVPTLLATWGMCNLSHQRCLFLSRNRRCRVFCSQIKLDDDDETCELVSGAEIILGDGTDSFRAYLLTAVKNNNGTGIIILSDVNGFEASSTRDFAYRVACNGYNVLVPDLFRGNPWTTDQNMSDIDDWVAKQPTERVTKDINISAKWMVDEFLSAGISKKLGIIGFCFGGGRLINALAEDQGLYFSTAVCFYGTRMDLSVADDIKVPVLFICGDSDPLCGVEMLDDFEKTIGRGSKVVVFKGQGHGFVHRPESPEADEDAEEAFMMMRNWLQEGLVVGNK